MKTTRLLTGFIGLLVLGTLLSCEDHRSQIVTPGANRLRVKRIEQVIPTSPPVTTVMDFAYDGQNRLSSITSYRTPDSTVAPVEKTLYQYDPQNRLTQVQHSEVRRGSRTETYNLTYNPAGRLSSVVNSSFSVVREDSAFGRPPLSDYSKTYAARPSGFGSFTFTAGNLTAVSETFYVLRINVPPGFPPRYTRSLQANFTYDVSGINPFYGNFIIPAPGEFIPTGFDQFGPSYTLYGGIDNIFNLSPRNVETALVVITEQYFNNPTNNPTRSTNTMYRYTYAYNAVGLPTSRTTTTSNVVTEILLFQYETY